MLLYTVMLLLYPKEWDLKIQMDENEIPFQTEV